MINASCSTGRLAAAGVALVAVGIAIGVTLRGTAPRSVFAATAAADESFAACTAPVGDRVEGVFLLDFETGDLCGGVLDPLTAKFTAAYRHNVLKDLEFKAGKIRNPKFLLTTGLANFTGQAAGAVANFNGVSMANSVLYVTEASTGATVAYGIPLNARQVAPNGAAAAPLVPLDIARPRGGKMP